MDRNERNKRIDKAVQIVQLANRKLAEGWAEAGLRGNPPTVAIGQVDVILEAAQELGLTWEDIRTDRYDG